MRENADTRNNWKTRALLPCVRRAYIVKQLSRGCTHLTRVSLSNDFNHVQLPQKQYVCIIGLQVVYLPDSHHSKGCFTLVIKEPIPIRLPAFFASRSAQEIYSSHTGRCDLSTAHELVTNHRRDHIRTGIPIIPRASTMILPRINRLDYRSGLLEERLRVLRGGMIRANRPIRVDRYPPAIL